MTRFLHKQWRNGRGGKWTRRVRWYQAELEGRFYIRLEFLDETGTCNLHYALIEHAQADYDAFRAGETSVIELRA